MRVQCPNCSKVFPVTAKVAGRKAKCGCGTVLQMPQLDQAAPAAAGQNIEMSCGSCSRRLSVPANAVGKMVKCPCGEQTSVPGPGAAQPANPFAAQAGGGNDPFADDSYGSSGGANYDYGNDPFDSAGSEGSQTASAPAYLTAPKPRPKVKKKKKKTSGSGSGSSSSSSGGPDFNQVFGGLAMMAGAVVWFVGGLFFGILFFYPPILLIIGFVAMIKGFVAP